MGIFRIASDPQIVDLLTNAGDPAEIVIPNDEVVGVVFTHIANDAHLSIGAPGTAAAGEGNTRIGADATRVLLHANTVEPSHEFPVAGMTRRPQSLYVRKAAATTVTDGLSFYFVSQLSGP